MRELKPYLEASRNNTTYIKKWIAEHPNLTTKKSEEWEINKGWGGVYICPSHGNNDQVLGTANDNRGAVLRVGSAVATLALLVALPPAGMVSFAGLLGLCGAQEVNASENDWLKTRKNWTLLEFAVGEGASDVAVLLISNGATITPFCEKLLENRKSKYPQLVDACDNARQKRTAMLTLQNELDRAKLIERALKTEITDLKKQIQEGKDREAKLRDDLTKAQTQQQTPGVNQIPQLTQLQTEIAKLQTDLVHLKTRKQHYKNNVANLFKLVKEQAPALFQNGAKLTPL